ncbi:uncharacterized protein J4E79_004711 [Alternaria viburni]|uniref:uncharacterized protein n=1 Tax=Alternaria viburni TaxID=566460 RepID=UPI0020C3897F|nr:uncharacterized protein J4E79_004711 [Alternaria viburni]KAI4662422.1 hypothetical protein J4E79_004711 [Alternaria viburni]
MGGKNKKKGASGADGVASSSKKKKGRGGMSDKQEENKTRTLEDLNSSSAWDRDDAGDDATLEPDDAAETSEEPIESTPTIEAQDITETEPVKNDDPQDELPQQEPDVAETETPWTTTPSARKKKASNVSDAGDVSSDTLPNSQAPAISWSFGEKGVTNVAKSQDAGQPQDTTNFEADLGDKLKHLSLGKQTLQEDVEVTDGEEKQGTIVSADNVVCRPKVEDEAAPGNSSDESSAPLEGHRALSPPPLESQLEETHEPTENLGNKARASTELPAQKPKPNDRLAPSTQEMVKQPATALTLAVKPQLPSKPQSSTEVQQTQAPPPAQLQQPPKAKPPTQVQHTQTPPPAQPPKAKAPIQAQTKSPAQSQRPSKPKTSVQVQGTQTEPWTPPLPPVTPRNPTRDQGTQTKPWTPPLPPVEPKKPTRDQGTQTEPWVEPQPPAKRETITRNQGAQTQVSSSSAPKPKSHGRLMAQQAEHHSEDPTCLQRLRFDQLQINADHLDQS